MAQLSKKELVKAEEAEGHLKAKFGELQCLWQIVKPKGTTYALLTAYMVMNYNGQPRIMLLLVFGGGNGWDVFGCPTTNKIDDTMAALAQMWGGK